MRRRSHVHAMVYIFDGGMQGGTVDWVCIWSQEGKNDGRLFKLHILVHQHVASHGLKP